MRLHVVSQYVGMLKILTNDWTETGRRQFISGMRLLQTGRRLNWSGRRLANHAEIALFRYNIHGFICFHFCSTDSNGNTIFGWLTRISLLDSKPFASSSLYKIALCFLSFEITDLSTGIFFCTMFKSNSQIAFMMFKLEDFNNFLRIASGAQMIRLIKLEYLLRFSIINKYSPSSGLFIYFHGELML